MQVVDLISMKRNDIFVTSSGQGTNFQLFLQVNHQENDAQHTKETTFNFTSDGEHILIVDDEALLRDIACSMLETLGYTVDSVSSGFSENKDLRLP